MEGNSAVNNINWISVDDKCKPKVGQVVLALAPSGYIGFPWMIFVATYDPDYKGWINIQNTRITDSCPEDVKYWAEMIETPEKG